ncbi:hypothetical protein [Saccharopolyspora elongata]|uniref:PsrA tetracyclin repressor-like C-terminal domain-containing protein n=1 Tax=Saccharopolyspora elongata TaxID=2530387 RepID=A0A4R4XR97_9PSEU|nr:hypothetical protein [Saccharopolyspora elongata]TDD33776.1 hypothetical protein E1288_45195 [Saccharopolyspora elongata]
MVDETFSPVRGTERKTFMEMLEPHLRGLMPAARVSRLRGLHILVTGMLADLERRFELGEVTNADARTEIDNITDMAVGLLSAPVREPATDDEGDGPV